MRFLFILGLLNSSLLLAQQDDLEIPYGLGLKLQADQFWDGREELLLPEEEQMPFEQKSPSKAFFYSLLLPGTGEAYVGEKTQSTVFLAIEIVAWGLVVANIINVDTRQDDYKNFAVQHALVKRTGKDNQYWIDIGKFDTIFEYNEERIRERDVEAIYPENRFFSWSWDTGDNRLFYDSQRIETREIEQNRLYFFAAIALNHLVSAINAMRLANAHNRKAEELSFKFNFDYNPQFDQFSFSLQKSF
jgi:hypothetical protein